MARARPAEEGAEHRLDDVLGVEPGWPGRRLCAGPGPGAARRTGGTARVGASGLPVLEPPQQRAVGGRAFRDRSGPGRVVGLGDDYASVPPGGVGSSVPSAQGIEAEPRGSRPQGGVPQVHRRHIVKAGPAPRDEGFALSPTGHAREKGDDARPGRSPRFPEFPWRTTATSFPLSESEGRIGEAGADLGTDGRQGPGQPNRVRIRGPNTKKGDFR